MSRVLGWWAAALVIVGGSSFRLSGAAVEEPPANVETVEVRPGRLRVEVRSTGVVRPIVRRTLRAPRPGPLKVLWIERNGAKVAAGDPVCRLDASDLNEPLIKQRIATQAALSRFEEARFRRELAEIDVRMYETATYAQEKAERQNAIKLAERASAQAETDLARVAKDRDRLREELEQQGDLNTPTGLRSQTVMDLRVASAEFKKEKAWAEVELAKVTLEVLERFTRVKELKQLQAEVQKLRLDETAREQLDHLAKEKERRLERDVADRTLRAPFAGTVLNAEGEAIAAGSVVAPGRILAHVEPSEGQVGVAFALPESQIELLPPGQPVRVTVPSPEGDASVAGVVASVARKADPQVDAQHAFAVEALIVDGPAATSPKPGATAAVHAIAETAEGALCIPMKAVVWFDREYRVGVKTADGPIDWREVSLGLADGSSVEVAWGLKAGGAVAVNPVPLLSNDQRRKFATEPPPAPPAPQFRTTEESLRDMLVTLTPEVRKALREAAESGRPLNLPEELRRKLSAEAPAPPKRRTAMIASLVHKLAASTPAERESLKGGVCPESVRARLGLTPLEVGLVQEFAKELTPNP